MFSDDHGCFWIFFRYSVDVLLMFYRCSQDVPRMIAGFFQDDDFKRKILRNSMIPNYSMIPALDDPQLFDDPQPFDDPQLFNDQLEVWTLKIQKSMVIPSSPMVLYSQILVRM